MSKLSTLTLPLTAFFFLTVLVPVAAADHPGTCPAYTQRVAAADAEVAFNERGQALVYAGGYYMTWDYTVFLTGTDSLFSWWFYEETNGTPGLQRNDEFCDNTHAGEDPDGSCFC